MDDAAPPAPPKRVPDDVVDGMNDVLASIHALSLTVAGLRSRQEAPGVADGLEWMVKALEASAIKARGLCFDAPAVMDDQPLSDAGRPSGAPHYPQAQPTPAAPQTAQTAARPVSNPSVPQAPHRPAPQQSGAQGPQTAPPRWTTPQYGAQQAATGQGAQGGQAPFAGAAPMRAAQPARDAATPRVATPARPQKPRSPRTPAKK